MAKNESGESVHPAIVPVLEAILETARESFALDKDANGYRTLVGLTRAETVELAALSAVAIAGGEVDGQRLHALRMRTFAAHARRMASAAPGVRQ